MKIEFQHHVFQHDSGEAATLSQILALLSQFKKEFEQKMSQLDDKIAALQADVTAETTVEQSAIKLIQGVPQMIADAVTAALAAGATSAQLQSLTDLGAIITNNAASLGAAVTAGTPAAPAPAA